MVGIAVGTSSGSDLTLGQLPNSIQYDSIREGGSLTIALGADVCR